VQNRRISYIKHIFTQCGYFLSRRGIYLKHLIFKYFNISINNITYTVMVALIEKELKIRDQELEELVKPIYGYHA